MTQLKLLALIAVTHAVVDAVALVIQPLWPDLCSGLALDDLEFQAAYVLWNVATSLVQLPIGYWAERHRSRWLIWAGPAVGVACVGGVGLVDSFAGLCLLLALGGLGIAAFHPEAAALAASCTPDNRSRALSVFAVGGYAGQAVGPLYAGKVTAAGGMPAIAWTLAWGWPLLALVALALQRVPQRADDGHVAASHDGRLRGQRSLAALLVAVGVLRVAPVLGVPLALAFTIKQAGGTNDEIGFAQSLFMAAVGAGSLACALFVDRRNERKAFFMLPWLAAACLVAGPLGSSGLLLASTAVGGFTLGVTLPVLVSLGQQLLPGAGRVANGLTMGVTWAVASPLAAGAIELFEAKLWPEGAFYALAGLAGASSLLFLGISRSR